MSETAIQTTAARAAVPVGQRGLQINDLESLWRVSGYIQRSGLAPKGIESQEAIFTAIQLGLELGLTPMAALQNIGVINGRPGVYGDAALALVRASGLMEEYSERMEGQGDARKCVIVSRRKGQKEFLVSEFGVADAKRANLWGKPGPWSQFPDRMLKFRARGFNLRDNFGDVLKGLHTTEELQDRVIDVTESNGLNLSGPVPVPESDDVPQDFKPLPAPKTEEAPAVIPNIQEALGNIVVEAGHTWDQFKTWAIESGNMDEAEVENVNSFAELSADKAKRFVRAKSGLLKGLALVGGAK